MIDIKNYNTWVYKILPSIDSEENLSFEVFNKTTMKSVEVFDSLDKALNIALELNLSEPQFSIGDKIKIVRYQDPQAKLPFTEGIITERRGPFWRATDGASFLLLYSYEIERII